MTVVEQHVAKKKKNPINQSNKYEIIQSTPEMNRVVTIR